MEIILIKYIHLMQSNVENAYNKFEKGMHFK